MNNNTALCYTNGCCYYCNRSFKTKHEGCMTQTPLSFNSAMIVKMNQLLQNGDQATGVCLPAGMYVSRHCWTQIVIKSHKWSDYSYLNPCLSAVPVLFVLNWWVTSTPTGVNYPCIPCVCPVGVWWWKAAFHSQNPKLWHADKMFDMIESWQ